MHLTGGSPASYVPLPAINRKPGGVEGSYSRNRTHCLGQRQKGGSIVSTSNLQYHRHDQRSSLRLLRDVALQVGADFFFDHAEVGFLFVAGGFERFHDDLSRALNQAVLTRIKP